MNRTATYITGRTVSLILVLAINVLIVKLMVPGAYAVYAVLVAGATIANGVASLGSDRLVPKILGMAGRAVTFRRAANIYRVVLVSRVLLLVPIGVAAFYIYAWFTAATLNIALNLLGPYVVYVTLSAIYLDAEAASQSLNQQRLSRLVAIGEPVVRLVGIVVLALLHAQVSALVMISLFCITQTLATLALLANNFRYLYRDPDRAPSEPHPLHAGELVRLGLAAHLGVGAWMLTSPAMLRVIAASVLPAPAFAVLSFVQTIGASYQRYSPGFLLLPFVEAQIMRRSRGTMQELGVAAMLGLVWKIDLILTLLLICAVAPAAPMLLTIAARPEFAAYGIYIGLVLIPVPMGTVFRSLEVACVYVNAYGAILRASMLTLVSFAALMLFKSQLGILFILLIPIVDAMLRCAYLDWQVQKRGLVGIVGWWSLTSILGVGVFVTLLAQNSIRLAWIGQVALSFGLVIVGVAVVKMSNIIRRSEWQLISDRLPDRVARYLHVFVGSGRLPI